MATTNMSFDELCLAIESHQNELDGYLKDYGKVVEINKRIEYADMGNKQQVNSLMIALESITGVGRDTFYYDAGYGLESEESQGGYKDDFKRLGGVLLDAGKHLFRLILKLLDAVLIILKMLVRALYSLLNKFVGFEEEFNKRSSSLAESAREEVIRKAEEFKAKEAEHHDDPKQKSQPTAAANNEEVSSNESIDVKKGGFFSSKYTLTVTDKDVIRLRRHLPENFNGKEAFKLINDWGYGLLNHKVGTINVIDGLIGTHFKNVALNTNMLLNLKGSKDIKMSDDLYSQYNDSIKNISSFNHEDNGTTLLTRNDNKEMVYNYKGVVQEAEVICDRMSQNMPNGSKQNAVTYFNFKKMNKNQRGLNKPFKIELTSPSFSEFQQIRAVMDQVFDHKENLTNYFGKVTANVKHNVKNLTNHLNELIKFFENMKRSKEGSKEVYEVVTFSNAVIKQQMTSLKLVNEFSNLLYEEVDEMSDDLLWFAKNFGKLINS